MALDDHVAVLNSGHLPGIEQLQLAALAINEQQGPIVLGDDLTQSIGRAGSSHLGPGPDLICSGGAATYGLGGLIDVERKYL